MKTKFVNNIIEGYFIAIISVAFATCGLWLFRDMLEKAHIGLVYLLVVASVAGIAGTRPALFTAILSFLLWNFFFLHPIFTFTIHDPRDWILLCVFLIIGIMVGQITGRVRTREEEAIAREKDTNALYNAIVSINSQIGWEKILREMVDQVLINTGARGCAIIRNNENRLGIISRAGDVKTLEEEVVTYSLLLSQVWGPEYECDTQTLRVHIGNLRKKIEEDPNRPHFILTEPGVGYRFNPHNGNS